MADRQKVSSVEDIHEYDVFTILSLVDTPGIRMPPMIEIPYS
jgi:hypothetical protein